LKAQDAFYKATEAGDEATAAAASDVMLFSEADLAAFMRLYERIKSRKHGMIQLMDSRVFEPRDTDEQCMACLNDIRNEFMHYVPHVTRYFLLTQFPAITETGLHVIAFLLNDSGNIYWVRGPDWDGLNPRADEALGRAYAALARLSAAYADFPLPRAPLCGSPGARVD
jgi:hypothetical protein